MPAPPRQGRTAVRRLPRGQSLRHAHYVRMPPPFFRPVSGQVPPQASRGDCKQSLPARRAGATVFSAITGQKSGAGFALPMQALAIARRAGATYKGGFWRSLRSRPAHKRRCEYCRIADFDMLKGLAFSIASPCAFRSQCLSPLRPRAWLTRCTGLATVGRADAPCTLPPLPMTMARPSLGSAGRVGGVALAAAFPGPNRG